MQIGRRGLEVFHGHRERSCRNCSRSHGRNTGRRRNVRRDITTSVEVFRILAPGTFGSLIGQFSNISLRRYSLDQPSAICIRIHTYIRTRRNLCVLISVVYTLQDTNYAPLMETKTHGDRVSLANIFPFILSLWFRLPRSKEIEQRMINGKIAEE